MQTPEPTPAPDGANLIFIVGCPRSGTTWLQRLLAAHPRIATGQESRLFEYIGSQFRLWRQDLTSKELMGRGGTGLACYLNEAEFLVVQQQYLSALLALMLKEVSSGAIFLEKTPGHALFIPEIAKLLPRAKVIHVVRDPRDVTASHLAASKDWGRNWAARRVEVAIDTWRQHVQAARKAGALLPPAQFLEVYYEDLSADAAASLRQVAAFAGLDWPEAEMAQAIAANTADAVKKGGGTPIPIYGEHGRVANTVVQEPEHFVRKAQPGGWREDLTWSQRRQLARFLKTVSADLGRYAG